MGGVEFRDSGVESFPIFLEGGDDGVPIETVGGTIVDSSPLDGGRVGPADQPYLRMDFVSPLVAGMFPAQIVEELVSQCEVLMRRFFAFLETLELLCRIKLEFHFAFFSCCFSALRRGRFYLLFVCQLACRVVKESTCGVTKKAVPSSAITGRQTAAPVLSLTDEHT